MSPATGQANFVNVGQDYNPDNGILYVKKGGSGNQSGSSWDHAIPELADALKWAHENKTERTEENPLQIWVSKGIYKPKYSPADDNFGNPAGPRNSFLLVKDVKLYGGFDPDNNIVNLTHNRLIPSFFREAPDGTVLSGDLDDSGDHTEPDARHVVISAGEAGTARLDGFTITGGYIGWPDDKATGITVNSQAVTAYSGAGIHVTRSSPSLSHLHLSHNRGYLNLTVNDGLVQLRGMGIFMSSSSSEITHCRIGNNTLQGNTSLSGAGMYLYYSPATVTNVEVYQNSITPSAANIPACGGGGVYTQNSPALFKNVVIRDNSVSSTTAVGGGLSNSSSNTTLINVLVTGNSVTASNTSSSFNRGATGGGISNNASSPALINVTIAGNTASAPNSPDHSNVSGAGIFYFNAYSDCRVYNSIIWGNKKGNGVANNLYYENRYPVFKNSLLEGMEGSVGQRGSDPLFSDPVNGDYTVRPGSPAINAGDNQLYTEAGGELATDNDIAGHMRLHENNIDIGAYEHGSPLPVTLVAFHANLAESTVMLTWKTTEEVNASHFEVQRSADGISFEAIGSVPAKHSGSDMPGLNHYAFRDLLTADTGKPETCYYRLRMVDSDKTFTYSPIVSVQLSNIIERAGLYPNPAIDWVSLKSIGWDDIKVLRLYNQAGRELNFTADTANHSLDISHLPTGLYLLRIEKNNGHSQTYRLMVDR